MKELYKSAVDKIKLSNERKEHILNEIIPLAETNRGSHCRKTFVGVTVAAAFMIALFVVPYTRAGIVKASEYILRIFKLSDGKEVVIEENSDSISVTFDSESLAFDRYVEVVDERVYFKFETQRIDITDKCSRTSYYRYDYEDEYGVTHIIFVGGSVDNLGWAEFIFDADGTYITNLMHIPSDSPWLLDAEISIGVPTGTYDIDNTIDSGLDEYSYVIP